MRYEKGRKESTRRRVTAVASKRFRADGVAATGIAAIMGEAGLTNGAFYSHFGSKEDLLRASLVDALDQQREKLIGSVGTPQDLMAAVLDYLSPAHRDNPAAGCPSAALVPELARASLETKRVYTQKISELLSLISVNMPAKSPESQRGDATVLIGMLIGSLQLARAVSDKAMSDLILADAAAAALRMLRPDRNARRGV